MKSIFNTFILILISVSLFAQQDSILTKTDNLAWLESFKKIEMKVEQIEVIKTKIIQDTSYQISRTIGTYKHKYKEKLTKQEAECRILFLFEGYLITKNTIALLELINEENIEAITIIEGDIATIIGGSSSCGVISLNSNNRRLKRKVNRLVRKK